MVGSIFKTGAFRSDRFVRPTVSRMLFVCSLFLKAFVFRIGAFLKQVVFEIYLLCIRVYAQCWLKVSGCDETSHVLFLVEITFVLTPDVTEASVDRRSSGSSVTAAESTGSDFI